MIKLKGLSLWVFTVFLTFTLYNNIVECRRKYYVSPEWVTYNKAVELCLSRSMQLASIQTKEKNQEILQYLNSLEFWIWEPDPQYVYFVQNKRLFYWTSGILTEDTWYWINGTAITYFNWLEGNPSNTDNKEKCLEVLVPANKNDLLWNDVDCNSKRHFICESVDPNGVNPVFSFSSEKCYYINHKRLPYHEVVQFCKSLSMELISVPSVNKNIELHRLLQHSGKGFINDSHSWPFWSSGNRFADGKTFYWLSGEPIEYFNWQDMYDNGSYCITLYSDWTEILWENRNPCSFGQSFICENANYKMEKARKNVYYDGVEYRNYKPGLLPIHLTKQYYISHEVVTYYRAHKFCESRGLQLLSIQDKDKNQAIYRELNKRGITRNFTYWISAARVPGTNIWESDGGLAVKFFNWKKGSPRDNKYNANCIELFQSGRELKWNDIPCEYKRNFICENAFPKVNMYCIRSQEDVSEASGVQ
ncbi:unnamed protein product [Psylliodes chrysocephalus]|uniref:C-type lectin domain-containing protein n=1 Tax=Psylliodes chrysocephalus TaxID=3402493 RepID=A0A9P0GDM1_9CUCU|nr:unnamed protein product [Psylliodes chrysocephala]